MVLQGQFNKSHQEAPKNADSGVFKKNKMIGLGSRKRERKSWGGKQKKEENGLMLVI